MARIAVVERDPYLREVIEEILTDEGYTVRTVSEIWRLMPEPDAPLFDLLVVDALALDGWPMAIRESCGDPPQLVLGIVPPRIDARPFTFVRKPFELDSLVAAVHALLRSRH